MVRVRCSSRYKISEILMVSGGPRSSDPSLKQASESDGFKNGHERADYTRRGRSEGSALVDVVPIPGSAKFVGDGRSLIVAEHVKFDNLFVLQLLQ